MALYARAGWTSLSGPVVTEWAQADEETIGHVRQLAEGHCPPLASDLTALRPGTARGPLLGGNLSVLSRLVGTPYAPRFRGSILCLEDVAEAPYRVDRMLAHLQHAGILRAVNGVVLGAFSTGPDSSSPSLSLEEVFRDYLADRPYPVATGLSYGHLLPRRTLPLGGRVTLEATSEGGTLTLSSPIVR
jgi:muramoyltetrapeptide carboxypeptidase